MTIGYGMKVGCLMISDKMKLWCKLNGVKPLCVYCAHCQLLDCPSPGPSSNYICDIKMCTLTLWDWHWKEKNTCQKWQWNKEGVAY